MLIMIVKLFQSKKQERSMLLQNLQTYQRDGRNPVIPHDPYPFVFSNGTSIMKKYSLSLWNKRNLLYSTSSTVWEFTFDSLEEALEILDSQNMTYPEYGQLTDNETHRTFKFSAFGRRYNTIKKFFKEKYLQKETESIALPAENPNAAQDPAAVQAILEEVTAQRKAAADHIQKIDSQFKELRTSILAYKQCVAGTFHNTAFRDLAILMRDAENSMKEPETRPVSSIFVSRLQDIFMQFGIETIEPHQGETFDPQLHEKYDCRSSGSTVANIMAKGWKFGNDVLLKAIVETE